MAIKATYHGTRFPVQGTGDGTFIIGGQRGAAVSVADAAVSAALAGGFWRIRASTACIVKIGAALASASGGEDWAAGTIEIRFLNASDIIAVDAA